MRLQAFNLCEVADYSSKANTHNHRDRIIGLLRLNQLSYELCFIYLLMTVLEDLHACNKSRMNVEDLLLVLLTQF